jgi:hypothetical protein
LSARYHRHLVLSRLGQLLGKTCILTSIRHIHRLDKYSIPAATSPPCFLQRNPALSPGVTSFSQLRTCCLTRALVLHEIPRCRHQLVQSPAASKSTPAGLSFLISFSLPRSDLFIICYIRPVLFPIPKASRPATLAPCLRNGRYHQGKGRQSSGIREPQPQRRR